MFGSKFVGRVLRSIAQAILKASPEPVSDEHVPVHFQRGQAWQDRLHRELNREQRRAMRRNKAGSKRGIGNNRARRGGFKRRYSGHVR